MKSQLVRLLNDHQTAFLVVLGYELRLTMTEKDRVWEENLTALHLLIGRQHVLNQLGEVDSLALKDVQVHRFLDLKLVSLLHLHLAYCAA